MSNGKRVILIGYDAGLLRSVDHFIDDLPNFKRLIEEGCSSEARPSMPADTPTNWTTIATGAYSSTHGVFGFNNDHGIDRTNGLDPLAEITGTFNSHENKAEYIWQAAERSGKKMINIHYPVSFPWTMKDGIAVGGSGVSSTEWPLAGPAMFSTLDKGTEKIALKKARGWDAPLESKSPALEATLPSIKGTTFSWSAFGQEQAKDNEKETLGVHDYLIKGHSINPAIQIDVEKVKELAYHLLVIDSKGKGYDRILIFKNKSDSAPMVELSVGEWSKPLYDTFPTKTGETEGLFYFKLHELSPDAGTVTLVRTGINCAHNYTFPPHIAEELKERGIPYIENLENSVTVMSHQFDMDTDNVDDLSLLIEVNNMQAQSLANIAQYLLHTYPWDITYIQVHIPDGLNHTLGAYLHPDAEKHTSKKNIERAHELFRETYKAMDALLGRIWDECKTDDDVLAVVSDHGSVGAWKWIVGMGMLVKSGLTVFDKIPSPTYGFRYRVNMQKSKVFRGILSEHLFINLKGKFPHGIVNPDDYEDVRDELIAYLSSIKDPETNESPFYKILKKEDAAYLGLFGDYVGDVLTYVKPGYYDGVHMANFFPQFYWDYIAGEDVIIPKSGATHTPYHPDCPFGIMSTNAFFFIAGPGIKKNYRKDESIHLADVAPTLAHLAGIDRPKDADGKVLEEFFES